MTAEKIYEIQLKKNVKLAGKGYSIEYLDSKGTIYRHRLDKSKVFVGKNLVLITGGNIRLTKRGIEGG